MFKDVKGFGKVSYSNDEISKILNMPITTIYKCNNELKMKNFLTEVNIEKDGSGCHTKTKVFNLL